MRKTNALIFTALVALLYIFSTNAGTFNINSKAPVFFSELNEIFHKNLLYPVISRTDTNMVTATAVCIDGKEVVILENEQKAKKAVEELALYISSFTEGEFISATPLGKLTYRIAPYKKESISDYSQALTILKGINNTRYTIKPEDTLEIISQKFKISETALSVLNPHHTIKEGEKIIVTLPSPAITFKITKRKNTTVTKPIEYKYEYDTSLTSGKRLIESHGQAGIFNTTQTVTLENFNVINVDTEINETVTPEKAQIIKLGTAPVLTTGSFMRPVNGGETTSSFGIRERNDHKGIDIGLDFDAPIFASDGGYVITSCFIEGYGNTVIIDHKNGYTTLYAHCNTLLVSEGDKIYKGDEIAKVGSTGTSTGPHLHFEIQKEGIPIDPALYIN